MFRRLIMLLLGFLVGYFVGCATRYRQLEDELRLREYFIRATRK